MSVQQVARRVARTRAALASPASRSEVPMDSPGSSPPESSSESEEDSPRPRKDTRRAAAEPARPPRRAADGAVPESRLLAAVLGGPSKVSVEAKAFAERALGEAAGPRAELVTLVLEAGGVPSGAVDASAPAAELVESAESHAKKRGLTRPAPQAKMRAFDRALQDLWEAAFHEASERQLELDVFCAPSDRATRGQDGRAPPLADVLLVLSTSCVFEFRYAASAAASWVALKLEAGLARNEGRAGTKGLPARLRKQEIAWASRATPVADALGELLEERARRDPQPAGREQALRALARIAAAGRRPAAVDRAYETGAGALRDELTRAAAAAAAAAARCLEVAWDAGRGRETATAAAAAAAAADREENRAAAANSREKGRRGGGSAKGPSGQGSAARALPHPSDGASYVLLSGVLGMLTRALGDPEGEPTVESAAAALAAAERVGVLEDEELDAAREAAGRALLAPSAGGGGRDAVARLVAGGLEARGRQACGSAGGGAAGASLLGLADLVDGLAREAVGAGPAGTAPRPLADAIDAVSASAVEALWAHAPALRDWGAHASVLVGGGPGHETSEGSPSAERASTLAETVAPSLLLSSLRLATDPLRDDGALHGGTMARSSAASAARAAATTAFSSCLPLLLRRSVGDAARAADLASAVPLLNLSAYRLAGRERDLQATLAAIADAFRAATVEPTARARLAAALGSVALAAYDSVAAAARAGRRGAFDADDGRYAYPAQIASEELARLEGESAAAGAAVEAELRDGRAAEAPVEAARRALDVASSAAALLAVGGGLATDDRALGALELLSDTEPNLGAAACDLLAEAPTALRLARVEALRARVLALAWRLRFALDGGSQVEATLEVLVHQADEVAERCARELDLGLAEEGAAPGSFGSEELAEAARDLLLAFAGPGLEDALAREAGSRGGDGAWRRGRSAPPALARALVRALAAASRDAARLHAARLAQVLQARSLSCEDAEDLVAKALVEASRAEEGGGEPEDDGERTTPSVGPLLAAALELREGLLEAYPEVPGWRLAAKAVAGAAAGPRRGERGVVALAEALAPAGAAKGAPAAREAAGRAASALVAWALGDGSELTTPALPRDLPDRLAALLGAAPLAEAAMAPAAAAVLERLDEPQADDLRGEESFEKLRKILRVRSRGRGGGGMKKRESPAGGVATPAKRVVVFTEDAPTAERGRPGAAPPAGPRTRDASPSASEGGSTLPAPEDDGGVSEQSLDGDDEREQSSELLVMSTGETEDERSSSPPAPPRGQVPRSTPTSSGEPETSAGTYGSGDAASPAYGDRPWTATTGVAAPQTRVGRSLESRSPSPAPEPYPRAGRPAEEVPEGASGEEEEEEAPPARKRNRKP